MQVSEFNRRHYRQLWADLNRELAAVESRDGLAAAIAALEAQQRDAGFIQDDLAEVRRYRFTNPDHPRQYFSVQYNPRRGQRFAGAGRVIPPPGTEPVNDGCFLCRDNIRWQQRGLELGYDLRGANGSWFALMNAYPLMPGHAVLATDSHVAQDLPFQDSGARLGEILEDLVDFATRLPGYLGFYNGIGAGASIPGHLHFHFFARPEGYGLFPLEQTALDCSGPGPVPLDAYLVNAVYWRGPARQVVTGAGRWIGDWLRAGTQPERLSCNLIAVQDPGGEYVHLYFVPRDRQRSHAPEMNGTIGGLEVLGELVFSDPNEKQRLDRNEVDYASVSKILGAISMEEEGDTNNLIT